MVRESRGSRGGGRVQRVVLALTMVLLCGLCNPPDTLAQSGNSSWDVGAGGGVTCYTGDFNLTALPHSVHGVGGLLVRYELSNLYSLRLGLDIGGVRGGYDSLRYVLPEVPHGVSFSRLVISLDAAAEIHFLPYQVNDFTSRGRKEFPWTPYAAVGVGMYYIVGTGVKFGMPLGAGVKVALGGRVTLAPEIRFVKLFSDRLDGYVNWPGSHVYSSFHNKDWMSQVRIVVTYRLLTGWTPCPAYLSDDEQAKY